MFDRNTNFEASCKIRPIKTFDPHTLLEASCEGQRIYLSPASKLLWFHAYCMENGIAGAVESRFVSGEVLKTTADQTVAGQINTLVKEYWGASVIMNGEVVATAVVSGLFLNGEPYEIDINGQRRFAVIETRKKAIGAALSQAGFGIVDGFDMTENDKARFAAAAPNAQSDSNPAQGQPAGGYVQQYAQPAQQNNAASYTMMQNSFFQGAEAQAAQAPASAHAPASHQVHAPMSVTTPAPAQAQPPFPADPVAAAKQMVWTGRGPLNGMTLGQILSGRGGKRQLEYLINQQRTAENAALQDAARLILENTPTGE